MPTRPFTRRQLRQNARFLAAFAQTGNARLTCEQLGLNRSTYTKRRARNPAFAAAWDAALAAAHARFHLSGGAIPAEILPGTGSEHARQPGRLTTAQPARSVVEGAWRPTQSPPNLRTEEGLARRSSAGLRSEGGEPYLVATLSGRLQLRRAAPGRVTPAAERLFLKTLARTNNIRLAAAAAGFAHTSILARKRRHPAFARALDAARAEAGAWLEHREQERTARAEELPDDGDYWTGLDGPNPPPTITIKQALHALGAPPVKLPCTPFPAKRRP